MKKLIDNLALVLFIDMVTYVPISIYSILLYSAKTKGEIIFLSILCILSLLMTIVGLIVKSFLVLDTERK